MVGLALHYYCFVSTNNTWIGCQTLAQEFGPIFLCYVRKTIVSITTTVVVVADGVSIVAIVIVSSLPVYSKSFKILRM